MTAVKQTNGTYFKRVICVIMTVLVMFSCFSSSAVLASAASKTPAGAYAAIKKAYGSKMPVSSKNRIKNKSVIFGVRIKGNVSSYYAAQKLSSNGKKEYAVFICKASSSDNVKAIKDMLKKWKSNEQNSLQNYLNSTGKKLFKNAKIGSVGKFVYMVMLDTSENAKAVKAIKKTLK